MVQTEVRPHPQWIWDTVRVPPSPSIQDQYFFIYEAVAEVIVCGDTEVPIEQLEDYVGNILSVANEHSDHTNIELQFKVSTHTCVGMCECYTSFNDPSHTSLTDRGWQ